MEYLEIRFYNDPSMSEILLAWLGESGFDTFVEREGGLNAYIPSSDFDEQKMLAVIAGIPGMENIRYEKTFIKDQNWNTQWESNFEPVTIANKIHIRAPFHPKKNYDIELVIEPKMSFGTGHHSTTSMMAELMLSVPMQDKSLLDMGCGSGILAILAAKFGATKILAIDNDDWAIENCKENCMRNDAAMIQVKKGESELLNGLAFDIILANINRNVLLADIPTYAASLKSGGVLLLSGFLSEDKEMIAECAQSVGLKQSGDDQRLNWMAMKFVKENN
ncbi:MAG: 50S ribosomal protein L11 methyltransferase [Bacteroidia bacterium]|nr:50S ribosomal protein L11 methyltransferase [Bacteroidia bacterium]